MTVSPSMQLRNHPVNVTDNNSKIITFFYTVAFLRELTLCFCFSETFVSTNLSAKFN